MEDMKLNVSFQNTLPFSEPRLDCYQNCVATLLRAQGENIVYLGACWPWEFVVHAKSDTARSLNDYVLRNTKCVKRRFKTILWDLSEAFSCKGRSSVA